MKIAVSSLGSTIDSFLDHRCIRGGKYIIFDDETKNWEPLKLENKHIDICEQPEIAVELLSGLNIDIVITGHCPSDVAGIFESYNISIFQGADGYIKNIINDFMLGKYNYSKSQNHFYQM